MVTHRDPVTVTASMATMMCYALRMTTAPIDPRRVGGYWASRIEDFLGGCLRDRNVLPADSGRSGVADLAGAPLNWAAPRGP